MFMSNTTQDSLQSLRNIQLLRAMIDGDEMSNGDVELNTNENNALLIKM